jgi:hypothetical protein
VLENFLTFDAVEKAELAAASPWGRNLCLDHLQVHLRALQLNRLFVDFLQGFVDSGPMPGRTDGEDEEAAYRRGAVDSCARLSMVDHPARAH